MNYHQILLSAAARFIQGKFKSVESWQQLLTEIISKENQAQNQVTTSQRDQPHIIYLMSRDQRVTANRGLQTAQHLALQLKQPLTTVFLFQPEIKYRRKSQYQFMLTGLEQVQNELSQLEIGFKLFDQGVVNTIQQLQTRFSPSVIVTDFSPLRGFRQRLKLLSQRLDCPLVVVDAHNIVPVWTASSKQEYNAYFFRRKLQQQLDQFLTVRQDLQLHPYQSEINSQLLTNTSETKIDQKKLLSQVTEPDFVHQLALAKATNTQPVAVNEADQAESDQTRFRQAGSGQVKSDQARFRLKPGSKAATAVLEQFLKGRLINYATESNDPTAQAQSELSPYLHFGQISSLQVALAVQDFVELNRSRSSDKEQHRLEKSKEEFLEQLIVRKELSDNYCFYQPDYRSLQGAPDWAQQTLAEHAADPREYVYSQQELEAGQTHDSAWNAAQMQLVVEGKIHGYMRMYWAKKILEWTESPEVALQTAIKFNDKYSLDGHDPNGYVGCLWSIAGVHDRAWAERPIFGKIRYMSYAGLKRKFDVQAYIDKYQGFFD